MKVTALLVSHDGARWLPAVLEALTRQSHRPEAVVAVDTGSTDGSVDLLTERLGPDAVLTVPARSSYGAAVRAGLRAVGPTAESDEWVWLLHDDSAPAEDALEVLLTAARDNPSVSALGPKLREWPSLRRLLEVGVTISGTGRRETGLERGEYDQGQHDRVRDVLAVNTAGMLVRRDVLEQLGGFDDRLPIFGNDIDFGWRAARAGHRTMVAPDAVVFHAEAARRGVRRTPLTGRHARAERRAALYTLLVNSSAVAVPFLLLRLLFGSLLRALGFLLVRAPSEALDEVLALAATYARPDRVLAARAARRRTATVGAKEVRHLLAPPWLPYRHGLDFLTDLGSAVAHQATYLRAQRSARAEESETGPVSPEMQSLPVDTGVLARIVSSPAAAVLAALTVLALAGMRGLLGSGFLSGGALLPAVPGASDWWRRYLESWHEIGVGSSAPAAPYLLPLALAATVLLGKAWAVLDVVFLLVVPLSALGAYRFLTRLGVLRAPALWGAVAYALLPLLGGSVAEGRLGTVVAALVLPWVAHAALFLGDASPDRRWRAAWRTALLLALLSAFAPAAWFLAAGLLLVALVAATVASRRPGAAPLAWAPALTAVLAVPVLLLPWSVAVLGHGGASAWVTEAGLTVPPQQLPTMADVLLGRPGDLGAAPAWLSVGVLLAAVAALVRRDTRLHVLRPWVVLVGALLLAAVLAWLDVSWLGFPLLVAQAAAVVAAAIAGSGIAAQLSGSSFGWRQPVGLLVTVAAVLSPVAGLVWWAFTGIDGPLDRRPPSVVPTYMTDEAVRDPDHGVLLVRGSTGTGFTYQVMRGEGFRTGDDTLAPTARQQQGLSRLVTDLASGPSADDVDALGRHGVAFVYLPPPADSTLAGNLDSVSGLSSASAVHPGSRAWQLVATPSDAALPQPERSLRPWGLAVQALALLVAAVLAAPTRKVRR